MPTAINKIRTSCEGMLFHVAQLLELNVASTSASSQRHTINIFTRTYAMSRVAEIKSSSPKPPGRKRSPRESCIGAHQVFNFHFSSHSWPPWRRMSAERPRVALFTLFRDRVVCGGACLDNDYLSSSSGQTVTFSVHTSGENWWMMWQTSRGFQMYQNPKI